MTRIYLMIESATLRGVSLRSTKFSHHMVGLLLTPHHILMVFDKSMSGSWAKRNAHLKPRNKADVIANAIKEKEWKAYMLKLRESRRDGK